MHRPSRQAGESSVRTHTLGLPNTWPVIRRWRGFELPHQPTNFTSTRGFDRATPPQRSTLTQLGSLSRRVTPKRVTLAGRPASGWSLSLSVEYPNPRECEQSGIRSACYMNATHDCFSAILRNLQTNFHERAFRVMSRRSPIEHVQDSADDIKATTQ